MALKVWLPLNGDLENKGISDIVVTNNGATIDNNGKIGKCYSFDGVDDRIYANNVSISNQEMSACCWVKFNNLTNNNYPYIFALGSNVSGTSIQLGLAYWKTDGKLHLVGHGSETASTYVPVLNTWTHLCITIKGNQTLLYVNGVLNSTITNANSPKTQTCLCIGARPNSTAGAGTAISYPMNCCLNDIRIYDHCLSPLEVKEISQGLILHYKLDGFSGGAGENLAIGTNTASISTNVFNQSNQTGGISKEIVYDNGIPCVKIMRNDTAQSGWKYFSYNNFLRNNIKTSTNYTVSFDIKASVDGTIGFTGLLQGNATNYMTKSTSVEQNAVVKDTWSHIILHCLTKDSFDDITVGSQVIYMSPSTSLVDVGVSYLLKNMKLEEGTKATAWTPALNEMGIDTTKIVDSSGYENDGTVINSLTTEMNDTDGRYLIATKFSTNTAHIQLPVITYSNFGSSYTFSWWEYLTTVSSSPMPWGFSNGNRLNCYHVNNGNLCWNTGDGTSNPFEPNITSASLLNTWHHMAITGDGTNVKLYIDGEYRAKAKTYKGLTGTQIWLNGWANATGYTMTNGKLSDFRIYATTLSAEDIATLYHTPAQIDNLGGMHGFEFEEKQGNMLAVSPLAGSLTWDSENNYYIITSQPSTSNWGIGPSVGVTPKKIIPWGYSYRLSYEVYSPTAATWYVDYNNNTIDVTLSGNDNDTGRIVTGVAVPANQWTLITLGCSNTNSTKNPDHLSLYDYSTGLGPIMNNQSNAITWYMRNPQWYLVDTDESTNFQVYENGVFKTNFLKEDNLNNFASFRKNEKATWGVNLIEK